MIRELFSEEGRRQDHELWVRMDLLESVLPDRVKEVREASSEEMAYYMIASLRNAVQECPKFTANQKRLLDLTLIGISQFACVAGRPEERLYVPKFKVL